MNEINIGYNINWPENFWADTFDLGRQLFIEESEIIKLLDSRNKFICIWLSNYLSKFKIIPSDVQPKLISNHIMVNLRSIIEPTKFLNRVNLKSGMPASTIFEWTPKRFTNLNLSQSWFNIKGWDPYDLNTHHLKSEIRAMACAEIHGMIQTNELIIK